MSGNFSSENSRIDSDQVEDSENEMVIENEDNISGDQISQDDDIQINENKKIIEIKENEDQKLATYYFAKEDHTLGNALVFMLNQHPETDFCGYSLLHPAEQVYQKGQSTRTILTESLDNLEKICNIMLEKVSVINQLINFQKILVYFLLLFVSHNLQFFFKISNKFSHKKYKKRNEFNNKQ